MTDNLNHDIAPDAPERGPWMQTSLGGRFFPFDPRPSEVFIEDIANGLAQIGRYNGQRVIDRYYSVAEHSVLMAAYALDELGWPPEVALLALMHDAPEAYINDLNRATKGAMRLVAGGEGKANSVSEYDEINNRIEAVVFEKFGLRRAHKHHHHQVKELDRRIVPTEKAAVMAPAQYPWEYDKFEPLPVKIRLWSPLQAKAEFLMLFNELVAAREKQT